MSEPVSRRRLASQSSNSGCDGSPPILPKSLGVAASPRPSSPTGTASAPPAAKEAPQGPAAGAPPATPAAPPRASAPDKSKAAPDDPTVAGRFLTAGQLLFRAGKVVEARRRFSDALQGLPAEATWALAQSFDTHYLSQLGSSDAAPDMQRALQLYERAVARGATDAKADLERVRAMMQANPPATPPANPPPKQ